MKKLLLLISIIFVLSKGFGQSYIPFPDSAAVWVNAEYSVYIVTQPYILPPTYTLSFVDNYCVNGEDTLIGSHNYTKLNYCSGVYKGAMRDDNGKWLFVPKDSVNELLIFDFTLNAGDTVSVFCDNFFYHAFNGTVQSVDSVLVNGKYRKRLYFDNSYWIEGIGNTMGLLRESWANVSNYFSQLSCMSYNDTTIYTSTLIGNFSFNFGPLNPGIPGSCALNLSSNDITSEGMGINVFPNPTSEKISILFNQEHNINTISIFDCFGREIIKQVPIIQNKIDVDFSSFPSGVYWVSMWDESESIITTKKIIKIN